MIVQYQYITWSPPVLSDEQELEFGRQIALVGREHFISEFRKSVGKQHQQRHQSGIATWHPVARWIFTILGLGLIIVGLCVMDERAWRGLIALLVMVLGIYLVSYYFAMRKFGRWIDKLVARYAAHVARGGK